MGLWRRPQAAVGGRLGSVCDETFGVVVELVQAAAAGRRRTPPQVQSDEDGKFSAGRRAEEARRDSGESKNENPALGLSPPYNF